MTKTETVLSLWILPYTSPSWTRSASPLSNPVLRSQSRDGCNGSRANDAIVSQTKLDLCPFSTNTSLPVQARLRIMSLSLSPRPSAQQSSRKSSAVQRIHSCLITSPFPATYLTQRSKLLKATPSSSTSHYNDHPLASPPHHHQAVPPEQPQRGN